MNKFKSWLKIKFKKFLDVSDLEFKFECHQKSNDIRMEILHGYICSVNKMLHEDISHFQESVNVLHNTVENVVSIGTSIEARPNGRSWAVICIEGNINIVKFVDLRGQYTRDILHYLKQFETGRHCIDVPYGEIFQDMLFKF